MKLRLVFLVFVLITGYRPRPANDFATAAASSAPSAISDLVTGRASSCNDLKTAVLRCKTTAASSTASGGRGDGAYGEAVLVPSDRGDDDVSRSSSLTIDRSQRLLDDSDGRRKRRRRWSRVDDTQPTAGYRRAVVERQRPRTKRKTIEDMILYGIFFFIEKLELTVYLSLYKIQLLYTAFVAPLLS